MLSRNAKEKPRHVFREAGLIISSDLRPATPGSSTRLSTSLQFASMSAAWPIDDQLARARLTKPCPRSTARAEVLSGGVIAPPLAVDPATSADDRRSVGVELWTRITLTHRGDERQLEILRRVFGMSIESKSRRCKVGWSELRKNRVQRGGEERVSLSPRQRTSPATALFSRG